MRTIQHVLIGLSLLSGDLLAEDVPESVDEPVFALDEPAVVAGTSTSDPSDRGRYLGLDPSNGPLFYDHGQASVYEQLLLEYINRARADPRAEARRLNTSLATSGEARPPLAFQQHLLEAAQSHSDWMLETDRFSHTGADGSRPRERMEKAGYRFTGSWLAGENIAYSGQQLQHEPLETTAELHQVLFDSPGHQRNMLRPEYVDVGLSLRFGDYRGWKAGLITEKFAVSDFSPYPFALGVAYYDFIDNDFFDPGEQIGGLTVEIEGGGFYTKTGESGGYALPMPSEGGTRAVTFTRQDESTALTVDFAPDLNAKVDFSPPYSAPEVVGPSQLETGRDFSFSVTEVFGADGYQVSVLRRRAANTDDVSDASRMIDQTSSSYGIRSSAYSFSGNHSYLLAHPGTSSSKLSEAITYKQPFFVGQGAKLRFRSQLTLATAYQTAEVRVSADGGRSWDLLYSQPGNRNRERKFSLRTIDLSNYQGQEILIQFRYRRLASGRFYVGTRYGWYIDQIEFQGLEEIETVEVRQLERGEKFPFSPPVAGQTFYLQAKPVHQGSTWPAGEALEVRAQISQEAVAQLLSYDGVDATRAPEAITYWSAGITGVAPEFVPAYNSFLASRAVKHSDDVQELVEAINTILSARGNPNQAFGLEINYFFKLGVDVWDDDSLVFVRSIIAHWPETHLILAEDLDHASWVANRFWAHAHGQNVRTQPVWSDYPLIGITGALNAYVPSYNSGIQFFQAAGPDHIQHIVDFFNTLLASAESVSQSMINLEHSDYTNVGFEIHSEAVDLINDVLSRRDSDSVRTMQAVHGVVTSANRIVAWNLSLAGVKPSLSDFKSLGLGAITECNLEDALAHLAQAVPSSVNSLERLQEALRPSWIDQENMEPGQIFSDQFSRPFFLDDNGVTVRCPVARVGESGEVNCEVYTKRRLDQITPENASTTCTSGITDFSWMVDSFLGVDFNEPIGHWDTSSATNMAGMFYFANAFNQDISHWDTSSVTDMSQMFREAFVFNQDISQWQTASVRDMWGMFGDAHAFNQPIGGWDTSSVQDMAFMFAETRVFNQPIGAWDMSSVQNMMGMFAWARSFNQPIGGWDTHSVSNMAGVFFYAERFNQDLSGWDTRAVTEMGKMFEQAVMFNQDLSSWCVESLKQRPDLFDAGAVRWTLPRPLWGVPCTGSH